MKVTESDLKDYINGVFKGKYDLENPPQALFNYTSAHLINAFQEGWGRQVLTEPDIYSPDLTKFNAFRNNLFYFAGVKTQAHVQELQALMHDEKGNRRTLYEFTQEALKLDTTFNRFYLATEYDLTHKVAHHALEWKEIEATKEVFPILEWVTVMDANTRHAKFNGIKLPVDHPFWASHPQPLEYGCRCRKRQHRDSEVTKPSLLREIPEPPERPWYGKPWSEGKVWNVPQHPYHEATKTSGAMEGLARMIVGWKETDPLYSIAHSGHQGGEVRVSAYHRPDDIMENLPVAIVVARNTGAKIDLPEHADMAHYGNPDYQDRVSKEYGDLKTPKGQVSSITNEIKGATRKDSRSMRNPSWLIINVSGIDWRPHELARRLKGSLTGKVNRSILYVYVTHGDAAIKFTREDLVDFESTLNKLKKMRGNA
jgi:hypothetical protein